jgi:ketosteroid isomerase-like protein
MSTKNKTAVVSMLHAMDDDDEAALAALMVTDIRWWGPPSALAAGMPAPVAGRDGVAALLAHPELFFRPKSRRWTVHHLVAEDNMVAVHANLVAETVTGTPYSNEYVLLARIDDGLIAEVWEHVDTAQFGALTSAEKTSGSK